VNFSLISGVEMTDPKGRKAITMLDGTRVQTENTIHIAMEDLAEED
jgi:hypothetical protein